MNLALLQIANVPNFNYLEQYLKTCQKQQVSLLCFPEYVFEPFFTGENGRDFGESTGMGLYIVKTVCDNLGHKVEIKSKVEKGTQVSILFKK